MYRLHMRNTGPLQNHDMKQKQFLDFVDNLTVKIKFLCHFCFFFKKGLVLQIGRKIMLRFVRLSCLGYFCSIIINMY